MEQPITPEELERLKEAEAQLAHRREVDLARQRRCRARRNADPVRRAAHLARTRELWAARKEANQ